jgi:hypothetical protein
MVVGVEQDQFAGLLRAALRRHGGHPQQAQNGQKQKTLFHSIISSVIIDKSSIQE